MLVAFFKMCLAKLGVREGRPYRQSIQIVKELMNNRMYPTTIGGLEQAMKALAK